MWLAAAFVLVGHAPPYALAQGPLAYPTKPIRLIVPYPPGAGADSIGRALADSLNDALKQPVIVDNRAGAGAAVGTAIAAKAPPDGYTLLTATSGGMVYAPALGMKVGYDPLNDFAPVSLLGHVAYSLVTYDGLAPSTVREFVAYAKARPGALNFGSPGTGSPNHIGGVLLMRLTGIEMVHVPYKGGALVLTDMIAGQMHAAFCRMRQCSRMSAPGASRCWASGFPSACCRCRTCQPSPKPCRGLITAAGAGWWRRVARRRQSCKC